MVIKVDVRKIFTRSNTNADSRFTTKYCQTEQLQDYAMLYEYPSDISMVSYYAPAPRVGGIKR